MRRLFSLLLILSVALLASGCGRKEITTLQRKEAATLVSEANFAITLRDLPRAEGLLAKAVVLCPDTADYWLLLGNVQRRQDNRAGAKASYEQALKENKELYRREPKNGVILLQQVYIFALLGRADDAREAQANAQKNHADDRKVRAFVESKELDRILSDPGFKDLAI